MRTTRKKNLKKNGDSGEGGEILGKDDWIVKKDWGRCTIEEFSFIRELFFF